MRHQMSCCRFPSFPADSLVAFWNPKNPPAALLLHTNHPVQYQWNSRITRTVSWQQAGYYGLLLCAQGTFCSRPRGITLIESTQIRWFSRWSGGGGWSGRAIAQQRSIVSKLGLKGLSEYHSNKIAATLTGNLLKGRARPNLTKLGKKAATQIYSSPLIRKSYSLFLGWWWRRELLMTMTMMMSENQSSQSQVHVTAIQSAEDLAVKSYFK